MAVVDDTDAGTVLHRADPTSKEAFGWQRSLDAAIPAIVVIRVCAVRPFDGVGANYR
jgi:hypothetical protein